MKKKNITFILMVAGIAAFLMSACQKDSATLRLRIARFGGGDKVYIDDSSNRPMWEMGDAIRINNDEVVLTTGGTDVTCTTATSNNYKAIYPSSIVNSIPDDGNISLSIPRYQVYAANNSDDQIVRAPMGACANASVSGSATLQFHNLGALLAVKVKNNVSHGDLILDNITVTASAMSLWGDASLVFDSETPAFSITSTGDSYRSVTLAGDAFGASLNITLPYTNSGDEVETGFKTFYIYVPETPSSVSNRYTIEITAHNSAGDGVYTRSQSQPGMGNLARSTVSGVKFSLSNATEVWTAATTPNGIIRGSLFSVSSSTKVYFSQGNLQYVITERDASTTPATITGYYQFAANQSDVISIADNCSHIQGTGAIDLFGWGTGNNPTLCTTTNSDYNTWNDWGAHDIVNGRLPNDPNGSNPAGWRTLTSDELLYLTGIGSTRRYVDGDETHYGRNFDFDVVTYNGNYGLLIYPDALADVTVAANNSPQYALHTTFNRSTTAVYDLTNGIPSGCVFLPATNLREGTAQYSNSSVPVLAYWSANYVSTSSGKSLQITTSTSLGTTTYKVELKSNTPLRLGLPVRLVFVQPSK